MDSHYTSNLGPYRAIRPQLAETQPRLGIPQSRSRIGLQESPLRPDHAHLAFAALRSPREGQWYAFPPRALIFGAISAVLHYNCFSRLLTCLTNRIFGIPLVGYFDDYGVMLPDSLSRPGLSTFNCFCDKLVVILKMGKSKVDKALTFLGMFGEFPNRENGNLLRISRPSEKAIRWEAIISPHIASGQILPTELDKLIGRLSFSQTAIFGRFGRSILRPLYNKLTSKSYSNKLEHHELQALRWWEAAIGQMQHHIAYPKPKFPDLAVYTDAASKTRIISALIFERDKFRPTMTANWVIASPTGIEWGGGYFHQHRI